MASSKHTLKDNSQSYECTASIQHNVELGATDNSNPRKRDTGHLDFGSSVDEREEYTRGQGKPSGDNSHIFDTFGLFKTYFDSQLKDLKREFSSSVSTKLKQKTENFKHESHRIQFEFNMEIVDGLDDFIHSSSVESINNIASSLKQKINYRNKLIKVADSSPGGWATVREYEKPSLGSDSEDEKKLKAAESKALKRFKSSQFHSKSNVVTPRNSFSFMPATVQTGRYVPGGQTFLGRGSSTLAYGGTVYNRSSTNFNRVPRQASARDICFQCGRRGHFRRECVWSNKIFNGIDTSKINRASTNNPSDNGNK
ncbi:hypothetical protein ACF0H5_018317 [Mactra antiquata]